MSTAILNEQVSAGRLRQWCEFPWKLFTACSRCGEVANCAGPSRRRVRCRGCHERGRP